MNVYEKISKCIQVIKISSFLVRDGALCEYLNSNHSLKYSKNYVKNNTFLAPHAFCA